jgi:tetratricopeptide (TPR) repeat protein/CHAT domain-containing protein
LLSDIQDHLQGKLSIDDLFERAASPDLAKAATPASCAALAKILTTSVEPLGPQALLLATVVEAHVSQVDDLGHSLWALGVYEAIITIYKRHAAPEDQASMLNTQGVILRNAGRLDEAIHLYDQAIAFFEELLQRQGRWELANGLAIALMNKGVALQQLGRLQDAIDVNDQAIACFTDLVQRQGKGELANDLATAFMNKGNALADLGLLDDALYAFDQAIAFFEDLVQRQEQGEVAKDLAEALINKGNALAELGRLDNALYAFDQAIAFFEDLVQGQGRRELANGLAIALMNKGNALQTLGRFDDAVQVADQAIAFFEDLVQRQGRRELANGLAIALMNKGNALQTLGRFDEALQVYDQVLAIYEDQVQRQGRREVANDLAEALMNTGTALVNLGRLDDAVHVYDEAIAIREHLVQRQGRRELAKDLAAALMNKGNALRDLGRTAEADLLFQQVDPSHFRGVNRQKYHSSLGDRCWDQGEHQQALEHYAQGRAALRLARRTAGIDETWLEYQSERRGVYVHYVRRALERGRLTDAMETMQEAKASVLGDLRARLNGDGADEPAAVTQARCRLLDWLRQPHDDVIGESWLAERKRQTEEYLKTWRSARGPCKAEDSSTDQPIRVGDIQEHLAPGWAILDFWRTANEEVTVFILTRIGLQVERLNFPVEDQRFSEHLDDLQASLRNPLEHPHDDALYALYLKLFAPLRSLLSKLDIHGLYLVPHGYLHALPLHACCWKEKGQRKYLCDEFAVAYLPSAALLPQLPPPRRDARFFSLSNPLPHSPRTLPFSEYEGEQLRRRYGSNGRFYLGEEGTFARTADWTDAGIVHFSCHGYGDLSFAPLSFLELHDDWLLAHDVVYRRPALQDGALVLLNGCQTSVRDWRAVDEGMGLMSAFLLRGAGLVLATQWSVVDACANQMLLTFVERYLAGSDPVAALRAAQRQVRELQPDAILRHCEEVLAQFPETSRPYEVINICALAVRVCKRNGRLDDARDWFQKMAALCRRIGQPLEDEEKLDAQLRKGKGAAEAQWLGPTNFDHPIFWGAFQFVGRVV